MSGSANSRWRLSVATFLFMSGASSTAIAQINGSWSCDASNGNFREFDTPISPRVQLVAGQMVFDSRDFSGSEIPSAHIAFGDSSNAPDQDHCNCNGIRAQIFPDEPDTVKFYMVRNGRAVGMAQGPVGTPITFAFMIDGNGIMTASIGRTNPMVKSTKLVSPKRNRVHVTCSNANVRFLSVRTR